MADIGDEDQTPDPWDRHFYEGPLAAAATAMLHVNGNSEVSGQSQTHYEIYKDEHGNTTLGGAIPLKITSDGVEGSLGAEHVESIFLQGGAKFVKREPEDLTRKCISPDRNILSEKRRPHVVSHSDSPPALIPTQSLKDELESGLKDEIIERSRGSHTIIIPAPLDSGDKMSATPYIGTFTTSSPQPAYENVNYVPQSPQNYPAVSSPGMPRSSVYRSNDPYYQADYYQVGAHSYNPLRSDYPNSDPNFERCTRNSANYRQILTVDSSPDSGISSDTLPSKEHSISLPQTGQFTYDELGGQTTMLATDLRPVSVSAASPIGQRGSPAITPPGTSRSWHEYSRHTENDKPQIPKIYSPNPWSEQCDQYSYNLASGFGGMIKNEGPYYDQDNKNFLYEHGRKRKLDTGSECGSDGLRHSEDDKVYIEKLDNIYGFKYYFESPISTAPRREDDKITYINKGQFYSITLEYIPDPERTLKSGTVKSVIMLMFREEKSAEDERKAWHFWHSRQHSVKQRILDVDTKNSVGIVNCHDDIAHNAIAVYWNPLDSNAKVNIAIQCLSTDFSSQKGVRGLPLHIQIDTYEDCRDNNAPVYHRGYCQLKVFCDKGAERKTRDEEKRAQKRKLNPTSRKKFEDMYHAPCERYEFYSMADLTKEPVLFKPSDLPEKNTFMGTVDMAGQYYQHESDASVCTVTMGMNVDGSPPALLSPQHISSPVLIHRNQQVSSPVPLPMHTASVPSSSPSSAPQDTTLTTLAPLQSPVSPKYSNQRYHSLPSQNYGEIHHKDLTPAMVNGVQNVEEVFTPVHKKIRYMPPTSERLLLLMKTQREEFYHCIHVVPPTTDSLSKAIAEKYNLTRENIGNILWKNEHGVCSKVDDALLKNYVHEMCFLIEFSRRDQGGIYVTLTQLPFNGIHD